MTTTAANVLTELSRGRLRWDLLCDFPREAAVDATRGDAAIALVTKMLRATVDPEVVERTGALPTAYFDALRSGLWLRLQLGTDQRGMGLSDLSTFRVCAAAMEYCTAAGFALATHNGIGLPALLPVLPPGPQRDLVVRRLMDGALSGWADTEPTGAAQRLPTTIAEPVSDGGYRLSGQKTFISNGAIADELMVSATIADGSSACLFLVDAHSSGFRVLAKQEVVGLKGIPLATLDLRNVYVHPDRVLVGRGPHWRDTGLLEPSSSRGRTYLVSGAALAIARRAVAYQRDFVLRRSVDGHKLADLPAIQDMIAASVAEVFAIEAVVEWSLLGCTTELASRHRDRIAAKNITTMACWRVVETTMSLFAAEGAETTSSKRNRGAPPLPIEQLWRDARTLRITGGVDFAVDLWAGQAMFARDHRAEAGEISVDDVSERELAELRAGQLTAHNYRHAREVAQETRRLSRACLRLYAHHSTLGDLLEKQNRAIAAGTIARELFTMAVVIAKAGISGVDDHVHRLASVYCATAMARLPALWSQLQTDTEDSHTDCQVLCAWWLRT